MELLIATKNSGKIKELHRLLADLPLVLRSLNDFPNVLEPEEIGRTFEENAALKAKYYALQTGLRALADDSGLEVDSLNGAPGVFSARYAGENAADSEKIQKLLTEITETKSDNRSAGFVCSMVISSPQGEVEFSAEGICRGKIALRTLGKNGFGYDPVFIPEGFSETFGELSEGVKQEISHRGRAANKIIAYLRAFIVS